MKPFTLKLVLHTILVHIRAIQTHFHMNGFCLNTCLEVEAQDNSEVVH